MIIRIIKEVVFRWPFFFLKASLLPAVLSSLFLGWFKPFVWSSFLSLCGDVSAVLRATDRVFEMTLFFRCRTLSGSPRPKNFKKIHFIKNMRQHDTRNGRYHTSKSRPASLRAVGGGGPVTMWGGDCWPGQRSPRCSHERDLTEPSQTDCFHPTPTRITQRTLQKIMLPDSNQRARWDFQANYKWTI